MHQIRFASGLRPGPCGGGAQDAPPDRLFGWGVGNPLPIPLPLDAFGVSVPAPSAHVALPPTYFSFPRACLCSCEAYVTETIVHDAGYIVL